MLPARQLARRNLHPDASSLIRGRIYNRTKRPHGGTGANQYKQSGQNDQSAPTASRMAETFHISEKTIRRDAKDAELIDKYPEKAQHLPPTRLILLSAEPLSKVGYF